MPKHSFKVSAEAARSELDTSGFYTGDTPPNGTYRGVLKKLWLKKTKNDDPAFSCLFEIQEPKGSSKAKYNGAGVFDWLNLTDQGAPFVNHFLSALGFGANMDEINKKGGFVTDDEDPPNVTKLGAKRITGEQPCRFATKIDDRGNAKIVRALPPEDSEDDETEPDEETEGLAIDETEDETEAETDESGIYTEAELDELELSDLKEIAALYELELTPKARKATIMAAILEAQEAAQAEGDEETEEAEPDEDEAEEEAAAEEGEALSEEELDELELPDLKEYADSIGMEYAPKITKTKLIAAIVEFQEADEAVEDGESSDDAEPAETYTEDDLMELELGDLKELLSNLGGELPKPPIKRKVVTAILEAQSASGEPPF